MIPYQNDLNKAAVIIKKNGGLTPEKLMGVLEGSEYISVDLNEAETKVVVELDETKLDTTVTEDSDNLITSGAVFEAIADIDIPEYTAGANVSISDANVISATDTTYTAGTNVSISSDNVISASFTAPVTSVNGETGAVVLSASDILATNTQSVQANLERIDGEVEDVIDDVADLETEVAGKQDTLTAGTNISISNNTISATDTTYTASTGINISSANAISVDNTIALKSEIPDVSDFATETYVDNAVDTKSTVSVSATGTATDEIGYITVDGVEKKIAGGGSGGSYTFTNGLTESSGTVSNDLFPNIEVTKADDVPSNYYTSTVISNNNSGTYKTHIGSKYTFSENGGLAIGNLYGSTDNMPKVSPGTGSIILYKDGWTNGSTPTTQKNVYSTEKNGIIIGSTYMTPTKSVADFSITGNSECSVIIGYLSDNVGGSPLYRTHSISSQGRCNLIKVIGKKTNDKLSVRGSYPGENNIINVYADNDTENSLSYSNINCLANGHSVLTTNDYQLVTGKFNESTGNNAFVIGNGTDSENRSNALTVDWSGNLTCNNIPAAPTSDGNYVLKCSITDGVASYSWVTE